MDTLQLPDFNIIKRNNEKEDYTEEHIKGIRFFFCYATDYYKRRVCLTNGENKSVILHDHINL